MLTLASLDNHKECQDYFSFMVEPQAAPPSPPLAQLYAFPVRDTTPAPVPEPEPDYTHREALLYWQFKTRLRTWAVKGLPLIDRMRFERMLVR